MKPARIAMPLLTLLALSACGSAEPKPAASPAFPASYGEERPGVEPARPPSDSARPVVAGGRPWVEPPPVSYAPYGVEVLSGDYRRLPTFYQGGRSYVMGVIGDRYRIRISNPTSRRVEAVVSVDGLDAIDGKTASYDDKRGYVIPPWGDLTIDGFRTSLDHVATFRFSSVRDSYAGRKGQDRNVGVIGIAFFPERERPPVRYYPPRPVEREDRYRGSYDEAPSKSAPSPSAGSESAGRAPSAAPRAEAKRGSAGGYAPPADAAEESRDSSRPGLGTEFGERRWSSVHYTSFQRENPTRPSYIVETRYNDREGLVALGIPVDDARPYPDDLSVRESADPFPRSRFAAPPPR
jgi:hypothetical protein